jgi:lactate dehydrogenase-like 2-hydroxyacid dehydrogenase
MTIITVTRRWPEAVEDAMAARWPRLRLNAEDRPLHRDELRARLADSDILCPTVTDVIDADMLATRPRVTLIAQYGAGYDNIDIEAARGHGIVVGNTPDVLTDATADLAITLMLMVTRRAGEGERELRAGRWAGWRPTHLLGSSLTGRTLGIVGMGRIGTAVARRACLGLGMRVVYAHPRPLPGRLPFDATPLPDVADLYRAADVVSLHVPATAATAGMINERALRLMGADTYLVNTSRGALVDEDALVHALRTGVIAGAALDVYAREPAIPPGLAELDNVVLLPHLGSATVEARVAMGMRVIANIEAFLAGRELPSRVC